MAMVVDEQQAPLVVAIDMSSRQLLLSAAQTPAAVTYLADHVAQRSDWAGVTGLVAEATTFADRWQALRGDRWHLDKEVVVYHLDNLQPFTRPPGQARLATEGDRDCLIQWYDAFSREALFPLPAPIASIVDWGIGAGLLYLWETDRPVAFAGLSQIPSLGIGRVGPVYAPPEARGQGYGRAISAAVSEVLLARGIACTLYADRAQPIPNHIYQSLGYQPVAIACELAFERAIG
jgi:predicted GNAT family acetyltransferase